MNEQILDVFPMSRLQLRAIHKHRLGVVLSQLVFNLAAYAAISAIALRLGKWYVWPMAWWSLAVILSGFLGAAHDAAHGVFFKARTANYIAGTMWASLVGFNFTLYKFYHLEHHSHTTVEGDTEPFGSFPSLVAYFKHLPTSAFFLGFWRMSIRASFYNEFPHFIRTAPARRAVLIDNCVQLGWIVVAICLTVAAPVAMLLLYWVPMVLYFPMVFWTSLPEHYGCDEGSDATSNTRSTVSNLLFRTFFWNGNFHAEHHAFPSVPSANLPILHRMIGHKFRYRESSYIRFHLRLIRSLGRGLIRSPRRPLDANHRIEYTSYTENEIGRTER